MSWDSYIDHLIEQSKDQSGTAHVDRACIIGIDGGAPWTTTSHSNALKLQGQEGANIARCFKSKDFTSFMASGVRVEWTFYMFLREMDGKIVLAKMGGCGAITAQASKTAVVIAHCPEGGQHGMTNKAVAKIAEYLESLEM